MSSLNIVATPLTRSQTTQFLSILSSLLPYSIPLYRRIQWHLRHPPSPESIDKVATILVISQPPAPEADHDGGENVNANDIIDTWLQTHLANINSHGTGAATANQTLLAKPWIASHLDLASPGTTQAYTFASWEIDSSSPSLSSPPDPSHSAASSSSSSPSPISLHTTLLTQLFLKTHSQLIPNLPLSPPDTWLWLRDNGKWLSQPYSRAKVLFGSLHESVRGLVEEKATSRRDGWYDKWIIPGSIQEGSLGKEFGFEFKSGVGDAGAGAVAGAGDRVSSPISLPQGYVLDTLQEHELQAILDGSPIPRTLNYLKEVANAGVYFTDQSQGHGQSQNQQRDLVAYGFLNKDASLGGLLVQEAHQGKGLATVLARRLFALQEENFSLGLTGETAGVSTEKTVGLGEEKGAWLASSDVSDGNVPSRRVMEKLGGRKMWRVCWVEVDLDVVAGVKERYE